MHRMPKPKGLWRVVVVWILAAVTLAGCVWLPAGGSTPASKPSQTENSVPPTVTSDPKESTVPTETEEPSVPPTTQPTVTEPPATEPPVTEPPDTQPPQLFGVADMVIYTGDAIAYMKGVTATDDLDPAPVITVDKSAVNLAEPGVYPVIYKATDAAGNFIKVTVTLTVYSKKDYYVELDVIYEMVDEILADILTEDMTTRQQVEAMYKWIRKNCRYIGSSDKSDWIQAAYVMMTKKKGDCFNYFGLMKLMLERKGIPNIDVEKVPNYDGDSMHYWSLVSIDGGVNYYHVDSSPRTVPTNFCLVTDKVMDDFSAGYRNCFNRDKSLYPATPTQPLPEE